MSDIERKAEFWDRLLHIFNAENDFEGEFERDGQDEIYDLIMEYMHKPLLNSKPDRPRWCPACDKMDGHPASNCPNKPTTPETENSSL